MLARCSSAGRRHPAVGRRPRAAFELGQRQQVGHQGLHAVGLLRHQRQHALALDLGQRQVGHGLDETCQHRQRRADLVRDVGDEVAPHRVGALAFGDVLGQHQLHAVAVGPHQHREHAPAERRRRTGWPRRTHPAAGRPRRPARARGWSGAGGGRARGSRPKWSAATRVAPLDLVAARRAASRRWARPRSPTGTAARRTRSVTMACVAQAQRPLDAVAEFAPEAGVTRRRAVLRSRAASSAAAGRARRRPAPPRPR